MSSPYSNPNQPVSAASNWFERLVAAIIDSIPWAIIGYIVSYFLFFNVPANAFVAVNSFGAQWWWLVYFFIWPLIYGIPLLIYSVVMEGGANQATFGKKVMHLQVQTTDGSKPDSGKLLKRNISKILWLIFLIDIIIGLVTKGPDPRQRYFDRIAGTTVVSQKETFGEGPPPPPPPPPP
jgi:uncharacterized RDD family membrane protein YckC